MDENDLQLANAALRVLPDNDASEFEHWYLFNYLVSEKTDGSAVGFAIIDFDVEKNNTFHLPASYSQYTDLVTDHLASTEQGDPWGMLDDDVIVLKLNDQPNSSSGRALLFRTEFISSLLAKIFPSEKITPAEQKTLLHSLSGLSLKESAVKDGVSYETKKTQLKSIFQKTEVHRQQSLSNFLISHLLLEVAAIRSRNTVEGETDELFFSYVDQYMGSYVRASVIQQPAGKRFRIIEIGDPAGTPVVCVHHLGLINFSEDEIAEIYRCGIRLVFPLRHGAIGPRDKFYTTEQQTTHALEGIDLAVSLVPEKNVSIIGLLSGSLYAIKYLEYRPGKVKDIVFFGACYKSPTEKKSHSLFKRDLHKIAVNHKNILTATISFLLEKLDEPGHLKKVIQESNNNGKADNDVIDELFSDPKQLMAMQHRLRFSASSIAHDLHLQAIADWSPLHDDTQYTKIHFIHGMEDELMPISEIEKLASENAHYYVHAVEGAGNWLFGKHTKKTFSIMRDILDMQ